MTAQIITMSRPTRLECSACGAPGEGSCGCNAPYVAAGTRAAKKADSEKTDRALAAELGISHKTVERARKSVVTYVTPEKRVGKDGKKYPAKRKRKPKPNARAADPIQEDCTDCNTEQERWQHSLGNLAGDAVSIRAYWTREFGEWEKFEVPSSLVTLAKQAAKVWTELAADLSKKRKGDLHG